MSIDDDIFDITDLIDDQSVTDIKKSFQRICRYIAFLEEENSILSKENKAMRSVIKIIKSGD